MEMKTGVTYQAILGTVIATRRKELGKLQGEFADEIGISQSAWSRIEQGRTNISIEQLSRAAQVLQIPLHLMVKQADDLRRQLEANGVHVTEDKDEAISSGWLLLGAAALAALIIAAR